MPPLTRERTRSKNATEESERCLKSAFDLYAIKQPDGSSRVLEKDIHRILGIAGSGLLNREIDEFIVEQKEFYRAAPPMGADPNDFPGVDWGSLKSRFVKPGRLQLQWEDEGIEDRLEQFVAAIKMLSDSRGSNGGIDTNVVEFALQSCGEELRGDAWYEAMKEIGHQTKGRFDIGKTLKAYADLGVKVGQFDQSMIDHARRMAEKPRRQITNTAAAKATLQIPGGDGPRASVSGRRPSHARLSLVDPEALKALQALHTDAGTQA